MGDLYLKIRNWIEIGLKICNRKRIGAGANSAFEGLDAYALAGEDAEVKMGAGSVAGRTRIADYFAGAHILSSSHAD